MGILRRERLIRSRHAPSAPARLRRPRRLSATGQLVGIEVLGEMGIRHEDVIFITETGAEGMTRWSGTPEAPAVA